MEDDMSKGYDHIGGGTRTNRRYPIHIHLAAMAPQFMDVRTVLPLRKLAEMPEVTASLTQQKVELPRLPAELPKVLVIQRIGVPDLLAYKASIRTIIEKGWVVIAEFDDHPDLVNAVHGRPPSDAMWHPIRLAHAVQTATPALADVLRTYNPKVAFFPNAAFRLGKAPSEPPRDGMVRVFYGALNRERFSSRIGAALADLAIRRSDIQFVVVHDKAFFESLGPVNKVFYPALSYEQYLATMESCHLALMPLQGEIGEMYKSDVKFVEASSLGLATLASPVVYGATILDGVTGLIVPDVEGWSSALESLVSDRERLLRIANAAYSYVSRERLFSNQVDQRLSWYRHLWDERVALTHSLSKRFRSP